MGRCREVLGSGSIKFWGLAGEGVLKSATEGGAVGEFCVPISFSFPLLQGCFVASGSTEQHQVGRGMAALDSLGREAEKEPSLQGPGRLQCARLSHLTFTEPHLLAQAIHFLHLKDNFIL